MKAIEKLLKYTAVDEKFGKILNIFSKKNYGKVFIEDGQFEVSIPLSITLIHNIINLKDKIKDNLNEKFDFDAENSSNMAETIDMVLGEFEDRLESYTGDEEFIECVLNQYSLAIFIYTIRSYGEVVGYKEKEPDDFDFDLVIFVLTAEMCKDAMFDIYKLVDNHLAGVEDFVQEEEVDSKDMNIEDLVS